MSQSARSSNKTNFTIFNQNIRGLGSKTDELTINWGKDAPHVLCLSEHHLSTEVIQKMSIDNYNLGEYYSRKITRCSGVCIFIHKSYQFTTVDLNSHCKEQVFEVCAIRVAHNSVNFCIFSVSRSPSGNFDTFMKKLEDVLNLLFLNSMDFIVCVDFNVNFMTVNSQKQQIISLFKTYNLDYIVNFPTRINRQSASIIDNIFLHKVKIKTILLNHTIMDCLIMMR